VAWKHKSFDYASHIVGKDIFYFIIQVLIWEQRNFSPPPVHWILCYTAGYTGASSQLAIQVTGSLLLMYCNCSDILNWGIRALRSHAILLLYYYSTTTNYYMLQQMEKKRNTNILNILWIIFQGRKKQVNTTRHTSNYMPKCKPI